MTGAPGPSHLGTWETMNPMRANSERLAAPQVLADDFLSRAHNRSNRKCEACMTTIQSPTRAILVPQSLVPQSLVPQSLVPQSLVPSPSVPSPSVPSPSPKNRHTPTPPLCGKRLFDPRIARNLNGFNVMHFRPVDESVNTNPVFCPLFGQKGRQLGQKSPLLRVS